MTFPAGIRFGARDSRLSKIQAESVLVRLKGYTPVVRYYDSPGDRDQITDLRESPADFFTRDLDNALRRKEIDAALHSAKDLPDPFPEDLDWVWLPWREDPGDVIVLPQNRQMSDLPCRPRIGVSSIRRETWCQARFPGAILCPVRGVIESRLSQLDSGSYDLLIMAAAALIRLSLSGRISEFIPLQELASPDGQGALAMTYLKGDLVMNRLRTNFVYPVVFAGAGSGRAGTCTLEVREEISRAGVCLYDALLDHSLLDFLPDTCRKINAGKRCSDHGKGQDAINRLLADYARQGVRVLRLKGGDPGFFGRLTEETETLDALHLPYRVLPGVSSLQLATTGTGMLLTRRGQSRGFTVFTPVRGKNTRDHARVIPGHLPVAVFMGLTRCSELCSEFIRNNISAATPAAAVLGAGSADEKIIRGTLATLPGMIAAGDHSAPELPGILIIGREALGSYCGRKAYPLAGIRIVLTGSNSLLSRACHACTDRGAIPVVFPVISFVYEPECEKTLTRLDEFSMLVITSPTAVSFFRTGLTRAGLDLRSVPKIAVCGRETANTLSGYGIVPDLAPDRYFGADSLIRLFNKKKISKGIKVLRAGSDQAGSAISDALRKLGADITDVVLYHTRPRSFSSEEFPAGNCILFGSASAVHSAVSSTGTDKLAQYDLLPLGEPTARAIKAHGLNPIFVPSEADAATAINEYALYITANSIN